MKIKEYLKKLNYRELISYFIVGVLTTIVALGTYYLLTVTILDPNNPLQLQIANILAWVAGVIFAYFTNRKFVFMSQNKDKVKEASKFVLSRLVTLGIDMLTMFILVTVLTYNDKISKLISEVLVVIGNYVISKLFVFKKTNEG